VRLSLKTNPVEEISRQSSIQVMAWLVLAATSQVYSENWEENVEQKDLENLAVWSENSVKLAQRSTWFLKR
jgi:hypothetical protein